jgi:hypothetical protein
MTLKEKFTNSIVLPFEYEEKIQKSLIIADDYAIEFGEWLLSRATGEEGLKLRDDILEIFKKEKGL